MKQILVYGDSLSWGIIPNTRGRLPFAQRWPGVLENTLVANGDTVRVIEDCLNGRRTVWDDPFKPGRNGLQGVAQVMEMHAPLALAIVMLGCNDFQSMHQHNAWHSAQGLAAIVNAMRTAPIEPGMPIPPVMIISPPLVSEPKGDIAPKFAGARDRASGLAAEYQKIARSLDCTFLNAEDVIAASAIDGVHLDAQAHAVLGKAVSDVVVGVLGSTERTVKPKESTK